MITKLLIKKIIIFKKFNDKIKFTCPKNTIAVVAKFHLLTIIFFKATLNPYVKVLAFAKPVIAK